MANEALLLDAAIAFASGVVYAYVGWVTSRRRIGGEAQLAASLFSIWWYTLAAITVVGTAQRVLAYAGIFDLGVHATILHVVILALVAAFWALEYYLVYLFSGSKRWFAPISLYYSILYLWILYLIVYRQPTGVSIVDGRIEWAYVRDASRAVRVALGLAFLLPTLAGAFGYARLYFRVEGTTQRYRIALVSLTFLVWFTTSLVALGLQINDDRWWQEISRYFGLVAALFILAAYRPPGFVRRRWGIEPVTERSS